MSSKDIVTIALGSVYAILLAAIVVQALSFIL